FYLPFQTDSKQWTARPKDARNYQIYARNGPKSNADTRLWGTGRLEYSPAMWESDSFYPVFGDGFNQNLKIGRKGDTGGRLQAEDANSAASAVFEVTSPYVLINADFNFKAYVGGAEDSVRLETSTDNGRTWVEAGLIRGRQSGEAHAAAAVLDRSGEAVRTVVSGQYRYLLRLTLTGKSGLTPPSVSDLRITSTFQHNPRTLPALERGSNELVYSADTREARRETEVDSRQFDVAALRSRNVRFLPEDGQGMLVPTSGEMA
ncbi:MAG: hypothetical protein NTY38_14315, partial [Acidobacteria bacterium]|nr:hypothetical protein [Acidobacteriota bacterium]